MKYRIPLGRVPTVTAGSNGSGVFDEPTAACCADIAAGAKQRTAIAKNLFMRPRYHPDWQSRQESGRRIARASSVQLRGRLEKRRAIGGVVPPAPPEYDRRIQYTRALVPRARS